MIKALFAFLMSAVFGVCLCTGARADDGPPATTESPFACNVKALTPAARTRHFDEVGPAMRAMRLAVRELPNGYAFQFPADPAAVALIAEWVTGERACCPFFDIAMSFDREGGPFWLTITGRPGTKDFIKADAPDWIK
jgi:hypothetical protein